METFYFLRQNLFESLGMIEIVGHTEVTGRYSWTMGLAFAEPVAEQTLLLDPAYGENYPDFFDTTIPVMSQKLIADLRDGGVDNIDTYPMVLRRMDNGEETRDYAAVNVVGCVDAVDLDASDYRLRFGKPYFTGAVAMDAARVGEHQAFRLLKGPGFIVVTARVAERLNAGGYRGLLLQPTVDYAGT